MNQLDVVFCMVGFVVRSRESAFVLFALRDVVLIRSSQRRFVCLCTAYFPLPSSHTYVATRPSCCDLIYTTAAARLRTLPCAFHTLRPGDRVFLSVLPTIQPRPRTVSTSPDTFASAHAATSPPIYVAKTSTTPCPEPSCHSPAAAESTRRISSS